MKWMPAFVTLLIGLIAGFFLSGSRDSVTNDGQVTAGSAVVATSGSDDAMADGGDASAASLEVVERSGISEAWLLSLKSKNQFDQIGALHERVKGLSVAEFPLLFDSMDGWAQSSNWIAKSLVTTKWAEVDPQGMLTYIESIPVDNRWGMQNMLFGAWAKGDLNAAFAAAQAQTDLQMRNAAMQSVIRSVAGQSPARALEMSLIMEDRRLRRSLIQSVIQAVSAEDPQAAIRMAEEQTRAGQLNNAQYLYSQIFSKWASKDGAGARQAALEMQDGPNKVQALSGAMQEWVMSDPIAALQWLDSLPVGGSVYNSRKEVFRRILNQDLDTARSYIESESDAVERRDILKNLSVHNFARGKSFDEIESLFDWVGSVTTGSIYDQKVGDVVRSMAEADPGRALEFMQQMRPGAARMNALGSIASMLAERDPVGALAFAQSLEYEDEKQRALGSMSWQLGRRGGELARDLVAQSDDPMVQQQMARPIVDDWAKYDRAGALAWVENLSDEKARNQSIGSILNSWIQAEPTEAIRYMTDQMPEGRLGSNLSSAFSQWARQDPAAAVVGLAQIPEIAEAKQADIYNRVAQSYVDHDPMAASEWIATLDDGPTRDATVKTLVSSLGKSDPEAGFLWSETLSDDNARRSSLNQTVRAWVKTDVGAALDAVRDSQISAAEKEPLLKIIDQAQQ